MTTYLSFGIGMCFLIAFMVMCHKKRSVPGVFVKSLTSVFCKPTTPPVALFSYVYWEAFDSNASGREIYVPMESVEAYKSAEGWKNYASDIVGYNF